MRSSLGVVLAWCAVVVLTLPGCDRAAPIGQEGKPVPIAPDADGAVPLRLGCRALDEAALAEAVHLWEAQRPDVAVAVDVAPLDQSPADVYVCGLERFRGWLSDGKLLDLKPFVVRDRYDVGDFDWRVLELFKEGDELYGLPAEAGAEVLYYNADLFRARDLAPPTSEWDWGDFLDAARALTRDIDGDGLTDQYGFLCPGGASGQWIPWIWAAGGRVIDPSGARPLIDQPEAIRGIRFYADLVTREGVALPLWGSRDDAWLGEDLFSTGRVAMCAGPPELAARGDGFQNLNWAIAPLPRGPAGRASRLQAKAYVISAATDRPDEAWELVKFLASPAVESLLARRYKVPPRQSMMLAGPVLITEPVWDQGVFAEAIRDAQMEPLVATCRPVHDLVTEEFDLLLRDQICAAEAAARMRERIEEGLSASSTN